MKFPTNPPQPQFVGEKPANVHHFENPVFLKLINDIGLRKISNGSFVLDGLVGYGTEYNRTLAPESLFSGHVLIGPDEVLRSLGGTTIFTTAGVQHIETIERNNGDIGRETFQIAQPVVRSQYMDKIVDGFSTAFINYSVISTQSSPEEFVDLFKTLIKFSLQKDPELNNYRITAEETDDKWGSKKFKKMVLTILYKDKEVSEGVLMQNFPTQGGSTMYVSDICYGEERFDWAYSDTPKEVYFKGFEQYYSLSNPDTVARLIDPIRTATLMIMQGVTPDHKDPGFRLRQLLKRFFERNRTFKIDPVTLTNLAFSFWKGKGVSIRYDIEVVIEILKRELERAGNVYIVAEVEKSIGKKIKVDVNKRSQEFLEAIFVSAPSDVVETVKTIIQ